MSTRHHDLSTHPPTRTYIDVAGLEAELAEAEQEARALLGELQAVEGATRPPAAAATTLGRKLTMALGDRHNVVALPQTIGKVQALAEQIRDALDVARAWAAEVEATRAAMVEALNADPAVKKARAALSTAHKSAGALSARLSELRRELAKLGDAPGSVEQAAVWAQQRAALQGELAAVERLEADARRPLAPAQDALTAAEGAVLAHLQDAAAGEVAAARREWQAALDRINAEGAARVASAERATARLKIAERTLQKGA
jgi:hypothetical protein